MDPLAPLSTSLAFPLVATAPIALPSPSPHSHLPLARVALDSLPPGPVKDVLVKALNGFERGLNSGDNKKGGGGTKPRGRPRKGMKVR